jgi:hypothetical protein
MMTRDRIQAVLRRLIFLAALAFVAGAFLPQASHAQELTGGRGDGSEITSRSKCEETKDGKLDCTAAFIEVGVDDPTTRAARCSERGCDDKDPYAMGCAVSYGVVAMRYIYDFYGRQVGYTQLWWSNTCQTNWARTVRTASNSGTYIQAQVTRDNQPNGYADSGDSYATWELLGNVVYTDMLYAPNRPYTPARACGAVGHHSSACTIWR